MANKFLFYYTGGVQTLTIEKSGFYKLRCWGAQGGSYSTYYGGLGGYSEGIISLTKGTKLYIYVGGQPETNNGTNQISPGGFNGGGTSKYYSYDGTHSYGQGGGGASDIRLRQDNIYARVIVAGGGAGSSSYSMKTVGYGGGTTSGGYSTTYQATQTAAGSGGTFYAGGNATGSSNYKYGPGGGGGGWYGGGASTSVSDDLSTARQYSGGGSGYVYTNETKSNYPGNCLLTDQDILTNAVTLSGNTQIPDKNGSSNTVQGSEGHGYVIIEHVTNIVPVTTFNYTGSVQTYVVPATGIYKLECYGAEGYHSNSSYRSYGGYAAGIIQLTKGDTLYVYVGPDGNRSLSSPSATTNYCRFNGGAYSARRNSYGGGGATDIRLVGGNWYDSESLLSRIMVAGGAGCCGADTKRGGHGGGSVGESISENYGAGGGGGTQVSGGDGSLAKSGSFGFGGYGVYRLSGYGGSGGGGWYGGGGVYPDSSNDDDRGGGGGSGYILTASSIKPSGYTPTSKYYFTNESFQTGVRAGDGMVIITPLNINSAPPIYVKVNGEWKQGVAYIKVNGEWKQATSINTKISGEWK